jgi:hypothetical protein
MAYDVGFNQRFKTYLVNRYKVEIVELLNKEQCFEVFVVLKTYLKKAACDRIKKNIRNTIQKVLEMMGGPAHFRLAL